MKTTTSVGDLLYLLKMFTEQTTIRRSPFAGKPCTRQLKNSYNRKFVKRLMISKL